MTALPRAGLGLFLLAVSLAVAAIHVVSIFGYHIESGVLLVFITFAGVVLAGVCVGLVAVSAGMTSLPSLWKLFGAAPGWVRAVAIVIALNAIANVVLLASHKEIKWHREDGHYFVHEDGADREVDVSLIDAEVDHLVRSGSGIVLWFYFSMLAFVWVWPEEKD